MGEVEGLDARAHPGASLSYACLLPAAPFEDAVDHRPRPEDTSFMAEALRGAARIPRRPWPNPPVGAVIVRDGQIVGRGAHHGAGTDHAEVVALRQAGRLAEGATLYCTLEPCNHQGRTPPCAPLVISSGLARLVIGIADPNLAVCGGGIGRIRRAGIEVEVGVLGDEALDLIWPFATTRAFERPFVLLKTATSIDGFFGPPADGRPTSTPVYLTGIDARLDVHRLRRWCDVVAVGGRTMASDRPRLDGRLADETQAAPAVDPLPAYVDTDLDLQLGWPTPHWVFAGTESASAQRQRGIERMHGTVVPCEERDGRVAPRSLVAEFQRRGGHCLMVEGGPTLAAAFLRAGVVDRWVSYVAPVVLGAGVRWPENPTETAGQEADGGDPAQRGPDGAGHGTYAGFHATRTTTIGPDVKTVFDRTRFDAMLATLANDRQEAR